MSATLDPRRQMSPDETAARTEVAEGLKTVKPKPFPYADVIKEADRRKQFRLMQTIKGRCVVEILQVVETKSGESILVTFFGKGKSPGANEKVVAWIWLVEQKNHFVRLEEVVHNDGEYLLDGKDLPMLLMNGDYAY